MRLVTVLTPTYNRREKLQTLFESLCRQTESDFIWMIVDDGSSDDTQSAAALWAAEAGFEIQYLPKKNGGKHTALNHGIRHVKTELTFIVDSDDALTEDAVAAVCAVHEKYKDRQDLCGYSFLRSYPDGRINGKRFPEDELIGSYIDVRINGNDMMSDKAEVFRTKCLREYPFPEFEGERFLGEDTVWIPMARRYNMVHINRAIYVGDYLESGLTSNRRRHNIDSPRGCMARAGEAMKKDICLSFRLKSTLQYLIYGWFAGYPLSRMRQETSEKLAVTLCALPAYCIYLRWKKDYEHD